ncbi:50S ribosomal protein L19, chloroplastic [Heracleum sosnowskyi]|uniref:50S ribosomal protein L19, chloroplastic n=1 Tax=Heracleum sosnowskyi TaxID=360622 RepID=A0AAD8M889_9APIA|nr:50S ribosomal protein L19, chloroplastic [Heracleum sosnowskyi]
MQSFLGKIRAVTRHIYNNSRNVDYISTRAFTSISSGGLKHFTSNALPAILNHSWVGFSTSPVSSFSIASLVAMKPTIHIPRIKFKRLDKTARNIMQILDKEAVEEVKARREIPEIKPGYIIQLKVETPENKRRVSTLKGIVIARRNAGLNTTIRLRRLITGIGVESLFPLYSPNIKEIKVLDKKKVRRAKLYYLRDRLNPLKNK